LKAAVWQAASYAEAYCPAAPVEPGQEVLLEAWALILFVARTDGVFSDQLHSVSKRPNGFVIGRHSFLEGLRHTERPTLQLKDMSKSTS